MIQSGPIGDRSLYLKEVAFFRDAFYHILMQNTADGYDYPPFRPPNEANSALIRITRGCPWNRCEFCGMYKHLKFQTKPLEEIKQDILKARDIYGKTETIFLGDSDNLVHQNLAEIVAFIQETFPEVRRITTYTRAKTILGRKTEFLQAVSKAGLNRLHLGLESGDAVILERLCKGTKPEQMILGGQKAKKAGFEVSFYVLSGAGGKDRWKQHALNSAKVLNQAGPDYIRLRTLTVQYGTPLDEKLRNQKFVLTPPLERLKEVKLFVETLEVKNCFLASDHLTNYLWADNNIFYRGIAGNLPEDKEKMLLTLNRAIDYIKSTEYEIIDSNRLYREGGITSL